MQKFRVNYEAFKKPGIDFDPKEGMTKQSFKNESDINEILARYNKTGQLPGMIEEDPKYGDFTDPGTYQDALNLVIIAEEQFAALPAAVRDRFGNDPERFLTFADDPKNDDEMTRMGLYPAPEVKDVPKIPKVEEPVIAKEPERVTRNSRDQG